MGHRHRPKRLAEKLLKIRQTLGLSQQQMAELLGSKITRKHVSNFERGKTIAPSLIVLPYARAANVQVEQIVDDELEI